MEAVLQWGLDCVRSIQLLANPQFTVFMNIITQLGSAPVYIIILSFMYWCIDEKKSLRLGTMLLISAWINLVLKFALDQPRPFFTGYDPSVKMHPLGEIMGGFPSGHAQNSLVLLAIIASWSAKKWFYALAAFFCLLIGFSRLYLGVHFPTDVLGGWLIGGILLAIYFLCGRRIEALLAAHSPRAGLTACGALAFIMILYRPTAEMVIPGAMLLGLGTGYFLCGRYTGFTASGVFGAKFGGVKLLALCARLVLGTAGLVVIYIASKKVVNIFYNTGNYDLVVFLRFALIALWISAGAPWFFRLMGPAERT